MFWKNNHIFTQGDGPKVPNIANKEIKFEMPEVRIVGKYHNISYKQRKLKNLIIYTAKSLTKGMKYQQEKLV